MSFKKRGLFTPKSNLYIGYMLVCLLFLLPFSDTYASSIEDRIDQNNKDVVTVMYVHSLSDDHPFYKKQNKALVQALAQCKRPVQVIHKYLNCRFWGKEEEYAICQGFCEEARTNNVQIILCEGDQALFSMLHCGDTLVHTLPLFYNATCINGFKMTGKYANVRGCRAPIDFEELFIQMQRLFPERNKYVVLRDHRMLSRIAYGQLKKEFDWYKQFNAKMEIIELDVEDSNFKNNYYKLRSNPTENILVIPYWGEIFYPIFREMQAPIVSFQPEAMRENIFGVYAPSRKQLGTQLGHYTAQYIDAGMDNHVELAFIEADYHWTCDYRQLQRFDLATNDFPENTQWKNKPLDPHISLLIVCALVIVFALLIFFIIMLIRKYRQAKDEKLISDTRAEAQKLLLIQRQHFADVLAHEHLGIISYNKNGDILFLNDCAADILRINEEEKASEEDNQLNIYSLCTLSRGQETKLLERLTNQLSEQNLSVNIPAFTYMKLKKTGLNIRISGMIRYVGEEQIPSFLMTVKQMTGEDLKDELSNLSVDIHRIYPFVYDFVTDSYHFTGAQPSFMRHIHNPSNFTTSDLLPFFHVDDVDDMLIAIDETFDELPIGKTLTLVYRAMNSKHEWEWFENRFRIIQMGDTEESLIGIGVCQSIQDKKERETQLMKARDKAKQADKLKTAFLANMSHEIRTPLNSIVGFASLLNHMDEYTQDEISEYISLINTNCDMLLNLIGDVLELSKIESGTMVFHIGMHPLHSILQEVMKSQRLNINDGVELICKLPEDVEEMDEVRIDPLRLRQVLHNLINNSKKFTESGSIILGCNYIPGHENYTLYVEDTGIGMSKEQCANVFQRFYKADSFSQGAGLGLSICQTIVKRMGGKITVSSEEGQGSRFEVILPLSNQQ